MLKLGNLVLKSPFIQAPLSGYSDYAMRRLARDFGAPLTFAGVMLAKSVIHPKVLRKPAFRPHENEHPVGAQILGDNPAVMATAAKALEGIGYDIIDLNFACPAPKVLRRHRGGYLLKRPEIVMEIYNRVRDSVTCPVTMKLRAGFDNSQESYDNFWQIVSEASKQNIDAIAIHGRTVMQKYTLRADWEVLTEIKKQFPNTTILGSGDLYEPEKIAQQMKTANLDGVIIARGAIGNPWVYKGLNAVFSGDALPSVPTLAEQGEMICKHLEMSCQLYPEAKAVGHFRKFLANYCKRLPTAKLAKKDMLGLKGKTELLNAIKKWFQNNHSN